MSDPLIYIVRADLPDDFLDEHHAWYARKHAPDVVGAGFISARGYDSPVVPKMWNIYEVSSVEVFKSDRYNNSHKNDPFVAVAVKKLIGRTVSVYTQVAGSNVDGKKLSPMPTLYGPGLSSLRFDSEAGADAVNTWFKSVEKKLAGTKGLRTIRLWEQREQHPKWTSTEPRWTMACEWESDKVAEAADIRGIMKSLASDPKLKASKVQVDIVQKRYGMVREDLFENNPQ